MSFLFPWAAGFAALIPVVIALYLLRQRRHRIVVPSIDRWKASQEPAPSRMAWGRIRGWRSLLLNLLILLFILLALLRPNVPGWTESTPTIITLDSRLRMQAVAADGSTAFERAQKIARSLSNQAGDSNLVSVVTTGGVASPATSDPRRATAAVDAAEPTDAGNSITSDQGVADGTRNVFITDRLIDLGEDDSTHVVAVGEAAGNVAITRFALRELPDGGQSQALFVQIQNYSDDAAERNLELRLDGDLLDVVDVEIPADGSFETVRTFSSRELESENGQLVGQLIGATDALAADDTGRAAAPVGGKPRVLLLSSGNWFLENAMSADPGIAFEFLSPDSWAPSMATAFDVVVFDDWLPEEMTSSAAAAGNFLFVGRNPWMESGEAVAEPVITETDRESPLLSGLSLEGAVISRALKVSGLRPVVRSVDDVLIGVAGGGSPDAARQVILAFRPGDSDLPLRVAFPLLISKSVRWLAAVEEPISADAGEPVSAGEESREFLKSGFPPIKNGPGLAINPAASGESDLRAASTSNSALTGRALGSGWILWHVFVVLALAALAFEWFAYHRWRIR